MDEIALDKEFLAILAAWRETNYSSEISGRTRNAAIRDSSEKNSR